MNNVVVFGSGGHSKVVIDIIEKARKYNILGLIDPYKKVGTKVMGYEVLGNDKKILELEGKIIGGIVAIADNWKRYNIVKRIIDISPKFQFIKVSHPSAQIAKNVTLGYGTVVMANAVINSDTKVDDHCIINTKASLDHECKIEEYVTLAPGATVAGGVTIGKHSVISLGASVVHNLTIGKHTVVGAGSTVLKNLDSYIVAYGTPARVIRERIEGEEYL